jgi:hypothetical protein
VDSTAVKVAVVQKKVQMIASLGLRSSGPRNGDGRSSGGGAARSCKRLKKFSTKIGEE